MEYTVCTAKLSPEFFSEVRCKRCNKGNKGSEGILIDTALLLGEVDQLIVVLHKSGYDCVQAELIKSCFNIINQLMTKLDHFRSCLDILILVLHYKVVETVQESCNALDSSVIPFRIQLRRSHKELIHS